jgi:hypothetical protein
MKPEARIGLNIATPIIGAYVHKCNRSRDAHPLPRPEILGDIATFVAPCIARQMNAVTATVGPEPKQCANVAAGMGETR